MFKRIASVAILVMLILSFTVGSVGNATAYQTDTPVTSIHKLADRFPGPMVITTHSVAMLASPSATIAAERFPGQQVTTTAVMANAEEGFSAGLHDAGYPSGYTVGYTTMVIEMGSIGFEPPFPGHGEFLQGQLFTSADARILTGNYITSQHDNGALVGNLKLYKDGNSTPKTFPVRWEANGSHAQGKPEYSTHMKINMSDLDPAYHSGFVELRSNIVLNGSELDHAYVVAQDSALYNKEIAAGDDNWHTVKVGDAIESLDVDLKWQDSDSDLRLMIYTSDGKVLGPYFDDADGTIDSRINLNISNTAGLASGEWYLKVTDTDKVGDTDYYVKTS